MSNWKGWVGRGVTHRQRKQTNKATGAWKNCWCSQQTSMCPLSRHVESVVRLCLEIEHREALCHMILHIYTWWTGGTRESHLEWGNIGGTHDHLAVVLYSINTGWWHSWGNWLPKPRKPHYFIAIDRFIYKFTVRTQGTEWYNDNIKKELCTFY